MTDCTDDDHIRLCEAVVRLADRLDGFDIGSEIFQQFTCSEFEDLADVLRLAGRDDTADRITRWHAEGDREPDDMHHDLFLQLEMS